VRKGHFFFLRENRGADQGRAGSQQKPLAFIEFHESLLVKIMNNNGAASS
jgi:hypothetical protein